MSRRAVLIGGTGQIGREAARVLAQDGWDVVAISRSGSLPDGLAELGVVAAQADRADDEQYVVFFFFFFFFFFIFFLGGGGGGGGGVFFFFFLLLVR